MNKTEIEESFDPKEWKQRINKQKQKENERNQAVGNITNPTKRYNNSLRQEVLND